MAVVVVTAHNAKRVVNYDDAASHHYDAHTHNAHARF